MAILAVNAGSSSLKFSLHPLSGDLAQSAVLHGAVQGLEPGGEPCMNWHAQGMARCRQLAQTAHSFGAALEALKELLRDECREIALCAVAHRVVHGGQSFRGSVMVNDGVLAELERLVSLAPLHQPHNLQGIRAFRDQFPDIPQVACFDTAFHASLPDLEYSFALPGSMREEGVRRYGFHGLSYQYIMDTLKDHSVLARGRVLMAHLGNGASLCAARQGRSCATTMGFSALDGLMMGTRSGSLDAGVLLHLMEQGWDHDRLQDLLYRKSGLLGVSGISADMRRLREDGSDAALFAIGLFTYRVAREAGALVACMGGLDVLVFSGGIGEHDAALRAGVVGRLAHLGVKLNEIANVKNTGDEVQSIHAADSRVEVWVIPTDEGSIAAREAAALLAHHLR